MKRNVLLIPFVAVLALMVVGFASAVSFNIEGLDVADTDITDGYTSAFTAGEIVPVRVWFSADEDQSDVEIEVEFRGYDETETVSQAISKAEGGE